MKTATIPPSVEPTYATPHLPEQARDDIRICKSRGKVAFITEVTQSLSKDDCPHCKGI